MKSLYHISGFLLIITVFLSSCSKDDEYSPVSPVVVNLDEVPYPKLSDYQFFKSPLSQLIPEYGVVPFEPRSILFTDYARKKRFVWMPQDTQATYQDDTDILNLPVGAVLIKNFYYDRVQPADQTQIIETRLMIKKYEGWIFANYVWNQEQTEAYLDMEGSELYINWIDPNNVSKEVNYEIPSESDCIACHRLYSNNKDFPIGIKPQNLNFDFPYAEGSKNQLQHWVDVGYLKGPIPGDIVSIVNYEDTSQPLTLRARSYLDANCAHCHRDGGYADHYILRLEFKNSTPGDNIGLCVIPEHDFMPGQEGNYIITPGEKEISVMYARMATDDFYWRMPFFGKTLVHAEGVALVGQWIDNMTENCN